MICMACVLCACCGRKCDGEKYRTLRRQMAGSELGLFLHMISIPGKMAFVQKRNFQTVINLRMF